MFIWTKESIVVFWSSFAVLLALAILVYFLVRNKSQKIKMLPIYITSGILIATTLVYQIQEIVQGYDLNSLPVQFCYFFVLWPLLVVCTKGKVQNFFLKISFAFSTTIFVAMVTNPIPIYGDAINALYYNHTFEFGYVFHEMIIFYFLLFCFLKPVEIKLKDWVVCLIGFGIFAATVLPCAYLLNENFSEILQCNFNESFENIRVNVSQVLYNVILGTLGFSLIMASFFITYGISKIKLPKKQ